MPTCKQCSQQFTIYPEDKAFYQGMSVPEPTHCPSCRQQRRMSWRNERTLYKRTCSATGKEIISMYPQETSFPVYDHSYFFSSQWDSLQYGRNFDFNRSFFEQFHDLLLIVPRMKNYSIGNENAEYGNLSSWNKNCYMLFEADNNEDCLYCEYSFRCKDVLDSSYAKGCELCYQCNDIVKCYNLWYSFNCKNCIDSYFLKNCTGCSDCFSCINLQNKQYYFFNEQLSREDYKKAMKNIDLHSHIGIQKALKAFLDFTKKHPHQYMNGFHNENCTGDYLNNSKNAHFCFNSSEICDSKYIYNSERIKDGYDIETYGGMEGSQLVYECQSVGRGSYNVAFGSNVYQNLLNARYCDICANAKNIFGCISVSHHQYCILNKQYSQKEYEVLVPKIIEHMKKTGEWGEFFPIKISPFSYNETIAQIYYPLAKKEALNKGYSWRDADKNSKNFKIQKTELNFYQKNNLPTPTKHPDQRYQERMALRNPQKLWSRNCMKCDKKIITSFAPDRPEIIYCKECYLSAVV